MRVARKRCAAMDAEFRGYRNPTAPLTWGQRAIWRSVVELPRLEIGESSTFDDQHRGITLGVLTTRV
jgi:hypothetical protein